MKTLARICALSGALCIPLSVCQADAVYKSVDETGHVTYSTEPPADAATVEGVPIQAGPSQESADESLRRAQEMEQDANAGYDSEMAQRRRQAEESSRQRAQAEAEAAGEAQRQAEESAEVPDSQYPGNVWIRSGPRPRPPLPPHPPYPPYPKQPPGSVWPPAYRSIP